MMETINTSESKPAMILSKVNLEKISSLVYEKSGIRLTPEKRIMLEGRLRRRMRILKLDSFDDYCKLLFSPEGMREELNDMIDAVTTNKTDFFREPRHYQILNSVVIPDLLRSKIGMYSEMRIWSAGCSSGEEPYTLAINLEEYNESVQKIRYQIYASDISNQMLQKAKLAVYDEHLINEVNPMVKNKYFLKSKDVTKKSIRVVPEIRKKVTYFSLNLMDTKYAIDEPMHIIFCRNVLIYFDRQTQEKILSKLASTLYPGGYLFHGHSESLVGMDLPLQRIHTTVYKKKSATEGI